MTRMQHWAVLFAALLGTSLAQDCWVYPMGGLPTGPQQGPVLSVITVADSYDIDYVAVENVSVLHGNLAALKITLSALPSSSETPTTVSLKNVYQGSSNSTGLDNVAFGDDAGKPMPFSTAANVTGAFLPNTSLGALSDGDSLEAGLGGSQGKWVLRIVDLGSDRASRTINLLSWSLVLCPVATSMPGGGNVSSNQTLGQSGSNITAAPSVTAPDPVDVRILDTLLERLNNMALVNNSIIILPALERAVNTTDDLRNSLQSTRLNSTFGDNLFTNSFGSGDLFNSSNNLLTRLVDRFDNIMAGSPISGNNTLLSGGRDRLVPSLFRSSNSTPAANDTLSTTFGMEPGSEQSNFVNAFIQLANATGASMTGNSKVTNTSASPQSGSTSSGVLGAVTSQAQSAGGLLGSAGSGAGVLGSLGSGAGLGSSGAGSVFQMFSGLKSSGGVLNSIKALVDTYTQTLTSSMLGQALTRATSSVTGKVGTTVANGQALAGIGSNFFKDSMAAKLSQLQAQHAVVEKSLTDQIDLYKNAVGSTGGLVSTAIRKYSDTLISESKAMREAAQQAIDKCDQFASSMSNKTRSLVKGQLTKIMDSASGLLHVGESLRGSNGVPSAVTSLMDLYKTQAEAASSILTASKGSAADQAQNLVEGQIEHLNGMLTLVNDALFKYTQNTGPLLKQSLAPYQSGLTYLMNALSNLQTQVGNRTPVNVASLLTSLGNKSLSGSTLAPLYDSLGVNARGSKVMELLGNANTFKDLYTKIFGAVQG